MSGTTSLKPHTAAGSAPVMRTVGRYRVLAELGRGGMASVYLAALRGSGAVNKLVVLKALLPDIASEPDSLAMFLDEARLAALLNHGNVVQTYEVGSEGDRHVIVMEYLDGQSLASVLRRAEAQRRPLPLSLHLRVLIDVLEGLHYAHELRGYNGKHLKLVHRDVSPQNVFITYDGRTKLLDFGIAKAATSTTHTATGVVKGKIAYMPPEQLAGEELDRRADVYAFGCMLWAAAAGQKLWKDTPDTRILRHALDGDIPSPQAFNPSCDPELTRIVMKALATNRDDRYATGRELQAELEHYCERIGAASRPRELSAFVSSLFEDSRTQLKAHIEQELGVPSEPPTPAPGEVTRSLALDASETAQTRSSTQTVSAATLNASDSRASRKRTPWYLAVGLLGAVLAATGITAQSLRKMPGTAPSSRSASAQPVNAPAGTANVRVELRASPSDARLYLDDEPVAGNPASRMLPPDGKVHQLRAELAGYQVSSAEFMATRDAVIELRLDALKATLAPRTTAAPHPARQIARKSSAVKSNCAQPFFVDSDGIKKVRPGCL
ncbi:MAG TPA: protein kinase [Polyangiaceae bacterium]|nr:protein kinase [Polyangiaceae bacterium]